MEPFRIYCFWSSFCGALPRELFEFLDGLFKRLSFLAALSEKTSLTQTRKRRNFGAYWATLANAWPEPENKGTAAMGPLGGCSQPPIATEVARRISTAKAFVADVLVIPRSQRFI